MAISIPAFQAKVDLFRGELEGRFQALFHSPQMASWLDDTGQGEWQEQCAVYLAKLPVKAARNVLLLMPDLLFSLVRGTLFTAAHPLETPAALGRQAMALIEEMLQPETWVRVGAGTLGSSLGYAIVAPLSPVALAIGGAMVIGGVSAGALKQAYPSLRSLRMGLEAFATGACFGLAIGGIQQAVRAAKQLSRSWSYARQVDESRVQFADKLAVEFIDQHHLRTWNRRFVDENSVRMYWPVRPDNLSSFPEVEGTARLLENIQTGQKWVGTAPVYHADGHVTYVSQFEPVFTPMIGYRLPLKGWMPPAPPPALPAAANLFRKTVLPATLLSVVNRETV